MDQPEHRHVDRDVDRYHYCNGGPPLQLLYACVASRVDCPLRSLSQPLPDDRTVRLSIRQTRALRRFAPRPSHPGRGHNPLNWPTSDRHSEAMQPALGATMRTRAGPRLGKHLQRPTRRSRCPAGAPLPAASNRSPADHNSGVLTAQAYFSFRACDLWRRGHRPANHAQTLYRIWVGRLPRSATFPCLPALGFPFARTC